MWILAIIIIIVILLFYLVPRRNVEKAETPNTDTIMQAELKREQTPKTEDVNVQDEGDVSILASLPKDELNFLLMYGSPEDLIWASRPRKFLEMTKAEKLQYIIDNYFPKPKSEDTSKQDELKKIIESIPRSDVGCEDNYEDCEKWAADNECQINPEYMLINCPKSCKSCDMKPKDRSTLIAAYNEKPLEQCVYHGANYPGEGYFLHTFYDYTSF